MGTELVKSPADRAFDLEQEIIRGCRGIRMAWVHLAAYLHEFYEGRMWELLGYERFNEWIAAPEISLGRSQTYSLIAAYHEFVVVRGVPVERLACADSSKVAETLPALKAGVVDVDEALSDAESLSRSDLRERYGKGGGSQKASKLEECPRCGAMRDPSTCPPEGQMEAP